MSDFRVKLLSSLKNVLDEKKHNLTVYNLGIGKRHFIITDVERCDIRRYIIKSKSVSLDDLINSKFIDLDNSSDQECLAARHDFKVVEDTHLSRGQIMEVINNESLDKDLRLSYINKSNMLRSFVHNFRGFSNDEIKEMVSGVTQPVLGLRNSGILISNIIDSNWSSTDPLDNDVVKHKIASTDNVMTHGRGRNGVFGNFVTCYGPAILKGLDDEILRYVLRYQILVYGGIYPNFRKYVFSNYDDNCIMECFKKYGNFGPETHSYSMVIDFLNERKNIMNYYSELKERKDMTISSEDIKILSSDEFSKFKLDRIEFTIPENIWLEYHEQLLELITSNNSLFNLKNYIEDMSLIEKILEVNKQLATMLFAIGCVEEVEFK